VVVVGIILLGVASETQGSTINPFCDGLSLAIAAEFLLLKHDWRFFHPA